jgi:phage terminase small subunit
MHFFPPTGRLAARGLAVGWSVVRSLGENRIGIAADRRRSGYPAPGRRGGTRRISGRRLLTYAAAPRFLFISENLRRGAAEPNTEGKSIMAGRRAGMHPPTRPTPTSAPVEPGGLSEREARIFRDLVAASDAAHFVESDIPLLTSYCQAVALHEQAVQALRKQGAVTAAGRASAWLTVLEKCQRAMIGLSMRLRLSPQARRERAQLPKKLDWMTRHALQQEAEE